MWRNYLTVGIRSLLRDPLFAAINLAGLAVGMAGCLLIIIFIRYQAGFDAWLPDAERTYQFNHISTSGSSAGQRIAMTPFVASTAMPAQFPEIETATAMVYGNPIFRKDGEPIRLKRVYWTDANFLKVLRLPLARGNPATALAAADSIVLSEEGAMQLFGTTDAVGRTVTQISDGVDKDLRVTGVLRDIPGNSHLQIGALYRRTLAADAPEIERRKETSWNELSGWAYARLRPGADAAAMNQRMPDVLRRIVPESEGDSSAADGIGFREELINVRDINTAGIDSGTMRPGTSAKTLVTFGIVAAFLLIVACVNFVNLATARASRRAREVGLRKTLGATRRQLIVQFLAEALVTAIAAGILALTIVELFLPALNALTDATMEVRYLGPDGIALPFLALLAVVGVLGGAYPAFFLSHYRPATVLKANRGGVEAPGTGRLRSALVILQFAVSIALIICTAVIYSQTLFARSADPGFKVSGLLHVLGPQYLGDRTQIETFMRRVTAIPGVTSVARAGITPDSNSTSTRTFHLPGSSESVSIQIVPVDGAAFQTFGMSLLAGRGVTDAREMDVGAPMYGFDPERDELVARRGLNVVLDESAARQFGFATPAEAVGRQIVADGEGVAPYTVVGVVNDARFVSMRLQSLPKLYFVAPTSHLSLAVRFENADGSAVMSTIEDIWKSSVDKAPFDAFFADERIANIYRAEERRGHLFAIFAGLAVFISCLGLFGLAAFTAERRTKEIGIRKVLGARSRDIVRLLAWQFSKPVIVANLIAWPVAWWAMRDWLNEFESRIDLGPTPFVLAGALALAIAVGTVAGHAIRVARANPIHALRYE